MKTTIVYIYPWKASFIQKDIEFLSRAYRVVSPSHVWVNKNLIPLRFVQQFFFLLRNIFSCRGIFVMFGGYWSLLPALFGKVTGKPVYIIPGGTDCVSFPSLDYGSLRKPLLSRFIKWSFQYCNCLLPVDESLVYCDYHYYEKADYKNQGFRFFFPEIKTRHQVVYNGFDPAFFDGPAHARIPDSFIVVAPVGDMVRFKLKGIDIVLELAASFRQCSFTLIGVTGNVAGQLVDVPGNVKILPFVPQDELKQYLLKTEFVLQLSISEGFPNSLGEAMLCGCIPVGSSVGAIPNIIGDTGFVMESSNINYIREKFRQVLALSPEERVEAGKRARSRIIENFHISRREKQFYDLISQMS
jgi:glycosyltransferase involved in cell wall biosynthesis